MPEIDPIDNVAPLVRTAHLQLDVIALVKLHKVIGLQDHVVELKEAQRLFAIQPLLDRVKAQHAVDREVLANIAEEFEVVERHQPFGIVQHQAVLWSIAKGQVVGEHPLDAVDIGLDHLRRHQLAGFVLEGRVTHHAGAATHQGNGPVAGFFQPVQHHDLDQAPHMQRGSGGVEPDIGSDGFGGEQLVQPLIVGGLMNKAALGQGAQEVGFELGHLNH